MTETTVSERPIKFVWSVDQDGYKLGRRRGRFRGLLDEWLPDDPDEVEEVVVPAGGLPRHYFLKEDGLWLKFAEKCVTRDGVLLFTSQYGSISSYSFPNPKTEPLKDFFETAAILKKIAEQLRHGDRDSAAEVFRETSRDLTSTEEIQGLHGLGLGLGLPTLETALLRRAPLMRVALLNSVKRPGQFEWQLVPSSLRDALLFQAADAIAGNRRFQRCKHEGCSNWFRLGPHAGTEGGKTVTARREFCTDRCRVAANRQKKKAVADA